MVFCWIPGFFLSFFFFFPFFSFVPFFGGIVLVFMVGDVGFHSIWSIDFVITHAACFTTYYQVSTTTAFSLWSVILGDVNSHFTVT